MLKDGKSRRDIARSVGRQYSSIQHVIYNVKSTRVYTSKPLLSLPSKLTIREKRKVPTCSSGRVHHHLLRGMVRSPLWDRFERSKTPCSRERQLKKRMNSPFPLWERVERKTEDKIARQDAIEQPHLGSELHKLRLEIESIRSNVRRTSCTDDHKKTSSNYRISIGRAEEHVRETSPAVLMAVKLRYQ
ncbi:hypothetical protein TNCV_3606381 [Trichonephila clavipes]|nr:hypothetical protein TNCV_3606381 [Trichonephila clavipes]